MLAVQFCSVQFRWTLRCELGLLTNSKPLWQCWPLKGSWVQNKGSYHRVLCVLHHFYLTFSVRVKSVAQKSPGLKAVTRNMVQTRILNKLCDLLVLLATELHELTLRHPYCPPLATPYWLLCCTMVKKTPGESKWYNKEEIEGSSWNYSDWQAQAQDRSRSLWRATEHVAWPIPYRFRFKTIQV